MHRLSLISLTTSVMVAIAGNNVNAQQAISTPSGTAYGLAVTYDFTFSNSKISGYVGPRILFFSGSENFQTFKFNTNQTNIGLIAGVDYAISDKFTAGINVIYDVSRSGSYSFADTDISGTGSISGSGFNVGINLGYSF